MSVATDEQLDDPLLELAARADAGQKLGMQALEFVAALAATQGRTLDYESAAKAMESAEVVNNLKGETAQIEKRSREITARALRRFSKAA